MRRARSGILAAIIILLALASFGGGLSFAAEATERAANRSLTAGPSTQTIQSLTGPITTPAIDPAQIVAGAKIYREHCASCHGAKLEGQPNWRLSKITGAYPAPPHNEAGHTWQHSDPELLDFIMNGVGGQLSEMMGFRGILSGPDMAATLQYIKSTWPPETREYQYRITLIHHIWGNTGH